MKVERARHSDFAAISSLLNLDGLPTQDLSSETLGNFLVVRDDVGVVGCVGIEHFGSLALLRSLVVGSDRRGQGMGVLLAQAAERHAAQLGVHELYLLTTTAREFFTERGYRVLERDSVPTAIRSTTEFSSLCPVSATVMVKDL